MHHPNTTDLDKLKAQHAQEEAQEATRDLLDEPRPMCLLFPEGGLMPQSRGWLERLYAGGRMAREKKPGVYDHLRSAGPWFVSVDASPMSVIDGMSQTATVCAGFAEDAVIAAYQEGRFGLSPLVAEDTSLGESKAAEALADKLRALRPGLDQVSFTNGGAEANEKAFALCRLYGERPEARRVLAFEGSFHGRTLLALHATWNPSKRGPFEFEGYEAAFAPYPLWTDPMSGEPEDPEGWRALASAGDLAGLQARFGACGDPLLEAEVASLAAAHEAMASGECFACVIEPMQSEGGDRYATARFFRALRLLTRHHKIPLIFDEVQTGFGLGGLFFWHEHFGLVDSAGAPDLPDAVVMAKRAQVGAVISRFEDPEPTSAHSASLWRGLVHAEMMEHSARAAEVEAVVKPRLQALAARFPEMVLHPRTRGFAMAFDMPSEELRNHLINQRFWRGAIVFGAGSETVRYRLSSAFEEAEVALVFEAIEASLGWLEANPGQTPPAWQDPRIRAPREAAPEVETRLRVVGPEEADEAIPRIMALEAILFEPARRDSQKTLRLGFEDADGVVILAEARRSEAEPWVLAGYAVAAPLEHMHDQPWVQRAPFFGEENTLYSIAISVSPEHQGLGLGREIKASQIKAARELRRADGSPRYFYLSGRNRVGFTNAMQKINRSFGAHEVMVMTSQYGDPDGKALYYRIPLGPLHAAVVEAPELRALDMAGTLSAPLAQPPASLRVLEAEGLLVGPTVTKITICNYITPAVVRAIEWVCALLPDLPHLYLTSGRDETVDKAVRTLRYHRPGSKIALGLEGGYLGHTSAGARSLSDPAVHHMGAPIYDWPLLPHPAEVGSAATIQALRDTIEAAGGPEAVVGLFVEPLQERTGRVLPADFWGALQALREELELPVVLVETASAYYRSGQGPFASSGVDFIPDAMIWWGGGQQGFVHMTKKYFIDKALMMVSTWDGDELSLVRIHHQLRAVHALDLAPGLAAMDAAMDAAREAGYGVQGLGLYRVIEAREGAEALHEALLERKLKTRLLPGGRVAVLPALDSAVRAAEALEQALRALSPC